MQDIARSTKKHISLWCVLLSIRLGRPRTLPSDTHEHAPFTRTAISDARMNSQETEQGFRDIFKMDAPSVTCKYELFSLCFGRFGGLNDNFSHSYYCNTSLRPYLCLWVLYNM